jgi:hypothetical protein
MKLELKIDSGMLRLAAAAVATPPNNSFDRSAVSLIVIRKAWMLG